MRKTLLVITALALTFCFSLSAFAASAFTVSIDGINEASSGNKTVIYTRDFGEFMPVAEGEYYVITVVPKITAGDLSENDILGGNQSAPSSGEVSETPNVSDVSEILSEASDVIPEIVSVPSVAETLSASDYKYKVEKVYSPSDIRENISIPQNGFAIMLRDSGESSEDTVSDLSSETSGVTPQSRNASVTDVEIGAPVAVYGIDFNTLTVSEGAYVQIELSDKGLLGDIPQTSDGSMTAIFTVVACLSVLSAAWFYRKKSMA